MYYSIVCTIINLQDELMMIVVCEFVSFFQNSRCLLNICIDFTGPQFLFYICLPGEYHSNLHSSFLKAYVLPHFNVLMFNAISGWSG
jgi:hypothetical protein